MLRPGFSAALRAVSLHTQRQARVLYTYVCTGRLDATDIPSACLGATLACTSGGRPFAILAAD